MKTGAAILITPPLIVCELRHRSLCEILQGAAAAAAYSVSHEAYGGGRVQQPLHYSQGRRRLVVVSIDAGVSEVERCEGFGPPKALKHHPPHPALAVHRRLWLSETRTTPPLGGCDYIMAPNKTFLPNFFSYTNK